jgi:hypothetical protein
MLQEAFRGGDGSAGEVGECDTTRDNLHTLMWWNVTKCMQQACGNFGGFFGVTLRILGGMGSTGRIGCGGSLRAILPTCSKVSTCRFDLDADSSPLQANTTALRIPQPQPQPQPPHTPPLALLLPLDFHILH